MGEHADALPLYQRSLALREKLDAADPNNIKWRQNLPIPYDRVGNELLALGKRAEAIEFYRKAMAVRESLLARNPDSPTWRIQVVYSLYRLGLAGEGARASFGRALAIMQQLSDEGRLPRSQEGFMQEIKQRLANAR
jgi:tetratricopeptide (TPR) repeat protein